MKTIQIAALPAVHGSHPLMLFALQDTGEIFVLSGGEEIWKKIIKIEAKNESPTEE